MPHVIEHASSGRAKCRGCDIKIDKDELRFGERQPNAFGEGEMTLWFHLRCAAYKRPEPFLEVLDAAAGAQREDGGPAEDAEVRPAPDGDPTGEGGLAPDVTAEQHAFAEGLRDAAAFGVEHRRVPRIDSVDRAPTGRARCRSCRELIEKDSWRIGLVFFEEYRFQPSGFIHAGCAREYLGTTDILERIRYFNPALDESDVVDVAAALEPRR